VSYANSPDVNIVSIDRPIIAGDWWPRLSVRIRNDSLRRCFIDTEAKHVCICEKIVRKLAHYVL